MAAGSGGFDVDPDEIDEHANKVKETVDLLHEALAAATKEPLNADAFGAIGQLFALDTWCHHTISQANQTLETVVKAGDQHAETVHTWAKALRVDEESVIALVTKAAQVENG